MASKGNGKVKSKPKKQSTKIANSDLKPLTAKPKKKTKKSKLFVEKPHEDTKQSKLLVEKPHEDTKRTTEEANAVRKQRNRRKIVLSGFPAYSLYDNDVRVVFPEAKDINIIGRNCFVELLSEDDVKKVPEFLTVNWHRVLAEPYFESAEERDAFRKQKNERKILLTGFPADSINENDVKQVFPQARNIYFNGRNCFVELPSKDVATKVPEFLVIAQHKVTTRPLFGSTEELNAFRKKTNKRRIVLSGFPAYSLTVDDVRVVFPDARDIHFIGRNCFVELPSEDDVKKVPQFLVIAQHRVAAHPAFDSTEELNAFRKQRSKRQVVLSGFAEDSINEDDVKNVFPEARDINLNGRKCFVELPSEDDVNKVPEFLVIAQQRVLAEPCFGSAEELYARRKQRDKRKIVLSGFPEYSLNANDVKVVLPDARDIQFVGKVCFVELPSENDVKKVPEFLAINAQRVLAEPWFDSREERLAFEKQRKNQPVVLEGFQPSSINGAARPFSKPVESNLSKKEDKNDRAVELPSDMRDVLKGQDASPPSIPPTTLKKRKLVRKESTASETMKAKGRKKLKISTKKSKKGTESN